MVCSSISSSPNDTQFPHQAVDAPIGVLLGIGGKLGVDRRGLGTLMTHLLLNRAQTDPDVSQQHAIAVALICKRPVLHLANRLRFPVVGQ